MDCGGKRSATPLSHAPHRLNLPEPLRARKRRLRCALPAHSKTWRQFAIALLLLTALASSRAQNFSIDWHTIDGGGGTSAGGVYSISGTIGQPDAAMNGGGYSLAGGFWSAVQIPGAPLLTIYLTTGNRAVVSWPSPATGFTLQQNNGLNPASWTTPPETVADNGTNRFILVNPPAGNRFYRLFKP